MPTISITRTRYRELLSRVGRAGVHALFPNDFEYYAMALEVVDSADNSVDLLVFPILPSQMSISKVNLVNVKKSLAGVVSIFNSTFTPFNIKISGNFGRNFKVLLQNESLISFSSIAGQQFISNNNISPSFDFSVKTGYGTLKVLERIFDTSSSLDSFGKPYKVYFYNLALNSNFLVELNTLQIDENDRDSNMLPNYSLTMTTLAPTNAVRPGKLKTALITILGIDILQSSLSTLFDDYRQIFRNRANRFIQ